MIDQIELCIRELEKLKAELLLEERYDIAQRMSSAIDDLIWLYKDESES